MGASFTGSYPNSCLFLEICGTFVVCAFLCNIEMHWNCEVVLCGWSFPQSILRANEHESLSGLDDGRLLSFFSSPRERQDTAEPSRWLDCKPLKAPSWSVRSRTPYWIRRADLHHSVGLTRSTASDGWRLDGWRAALLNPVIVIDLCVLCWTLMSSSLLSYSLPPSIRSSVFPNLPTGS